MKKTKQSFQWNKVTPLSKYLAMALFVALPFIGFALGMKYQQALNPITPLAKPKSANSPKTLPTPTPSPMVVWSNGMKVFVDKVNNFSITFSPDWDLRHTMNGAAPFSLTSARFPSTMQQGDGKIFFDAIQKNDQLSLLEWVKEHYSDQGLIPDNAFSKSVVNGYSVVTIDYTWTKEFLDYVKSKKSFENTGGPPDLGTRIREVYIQSNKTIIKAGGSYSEKSNDFFKEFDKIVSTISFTK